MTTSIQAGMLPLCTVLHGPNCLVFTQYSEILKDKKASCTGVGNTRLFETVAVC